MVRKAKRSKSRAELYLEVTDGQLDGVLLPVSIQDAQTSRVPLDFTSISSREIGQQHSAWAVRHSYLIYLLGNLQAEVANLKHDLKNAEAMWMVKHLGEYKNKWEAEHAMGRRKSISALRSRLTKAQGDLARYEALAAAYEGLRNAASREMSRRLGEAASKD